MKAIGADALSLVQLDDARRALLTAACSLRLVANSATDGMLLAAVERLHESICKASDQIAELSLAARVVDA